MKIEIFLGVALVIVSIGNYILYTALRNEITLLKEIMNSYDKELELWTKLMNRQTVRLRKLEDKFKYREKQAAFGCSYSPLRSLHD